MGGRGGGGGLTMREKPERLKAVRNLRQAIMYSAYWPPHTMLKLPETRGGAAEHYTGFTVLRNAKLLPSK